MLILLDCRPLQQEPDSEKSRFIISCVKFLSGAGEFEWLFLADGALATGWLPTLSGHRILTRKSFPGKGGWKWWYDWQIPLTARRYKPDLIMTTAGITAARTRIPQCIWMPGSVDGQGQVKKKSYTGFYRKRLTASLQQARTIFTFSATGKDELISQAAGGEIADRIIVIRPAAGDYPLPFPEEKEKLKERYAEKKEYFFVTASGAGVEEVVELLKAFSLFKKRQRSNMQLVLTGKDPVSDKDLAGRLENYKYRGDIHWTGPLTDEETFRLAGASYAIVFPFGRESLGIHILEAWKAGVPVITTDKASLPDRTNAALYARPGDPASLADQLMLIYKDEGLRNSLIAEGVKQEASFGWQRSIAGVRTGIMTAVKGLAPKITKSAIND